MGVRLTSLIPLVFVGFQLSWAPFIFSNYKHPQAPAKMETILRNIFGISLMIVFLLSLFSVEALRIFTTPQYLSAYLVVPWLGMATVLFTVSGYFSPGIGIMKKNHYKFIFSFIALGLNLLLNYILVPKYFMVGAAAATAISYLVLTILNLRKSQELYHIPHRLIRISLAFFVCFGASVFAQSYFNTMFGWVVFFQKLGLLVIMAGLFLGLKIFDLSEINKLWLIVYNGINQKFKGKGAS